MKTISIAGIDWHVYPLDEPEQIEFEVIFAQLCGAGLAVAIGSAIQGIAPTILEVLRDLSDADGRIDIAKIWELWKADDETPGEDGRPRGLTTDDPRLQEAWQTVIEGLSETVGDIARAALPAVTDRLTVKAVQRLFELTVLAKCDPVLGGSPRKASGWKDLTPLLKAAGPLTKWQLLQAVIEVTYRPDVVVAEVVSGAEE